MAVNTIQRKISEQYLNFWKVLFSTLIQKIDSTIFAEEYDQEAYSMFSLNYKTKGGKYPHRKPRIFFCCHPADFALLEHISEQLLNGADCTIWYISNNSEEKENSNELFESLKDMQLFVVPITTVFLNDPCYASQQLVPFLLEQNIPFLPLMQEAGLDDAFTRAYGNRQYLFEFDQSPAALPFTLKLEKHLQTILMKPPIDEIQSAFRARIFISYRKKDRYSTKKLMKEIHGESTLEDVAIWYDEYLVPGEDFHAGITYAIDNCHVFLLVVTPNLIKERNYVEEKEYPYAVKALKPIVPCEMQVTDHRELKKRYPNIPECIDITDLNGQLSVLLNKYSTVQKLTPRRQYIIGCAYLLGIDVEVDRKRGIRLIEQAAVLKDKDALRFMYLAYRYGNGVKQDAKKAFEWQKQYVDACLNAASTAPNHSTVGELIAQNLDIGLMLQKAGKYKDGIFCYEKVKKYIVRYAQLFNEYEKVFLDLNILIKESGLYFSLNQFRQAIECCENIISTVNRLPGELKDYNIIRISMLAYEKIGTGYFYKGDYASALHYYQNCHRIAKDSYEKEKKDKLLLHHAEGINEITGRIDGNIQLMFMDDRNYIMLQCHKDYAVACTKLADVYLETSYTDEAITLYSMSQKIFRNLIIAGMDSLPVQRELGVLHRKMADAYSDKKMYSMALTEMLEACRMGEKILLTDCSVQKQQDIAVYYYQTAQLYHLMNQKQQALTYYEKALDIINKQNPTSQIKSFKSSICNGIKQCRKKWLF